MDPKEFKKYIQEKGYTYPQVCEIGRFYKEGSLEKNLNRSSPKRNLTKFNQFVVRFLENDAQEKPLMTAKQLNKLREETKC